MAIELTPPDIEAFRQAFRRHAAGVAVITSTAPDGAPVGFTATSLASLAADPPMATFNMAQKASTFAAMQVGNHVAIHMLGPRSRGLAERMAADQDVRFSGDGWQRGPFGVPILDGATAWMVGELVDVHHVVESALIVARIVGGALGEADAPLVYHERTYMTPARIEA